MKKISFALMSVLLILVFMFSVFNVSAVASTAENNKYYEIIIPKVFEDYDFEDPEFVIYYSELYEYFSSPKTTAENEDVPDYVLVNVSSNRIGPMYAAKVFGDYILENDCHEYPFTFGYGIYIPSKEEIYSLSYAYEMNIEGIEKVFTEYGLGKLIGDMDEDNQITIKDATCIQKCLAGISEFAVSDIISAFQNEENPPILYVSDFNRDCKRNIKDATAIQKYLAKIDS